jgi:hypothetical protein
MVFLVAVVHRSLCATIGAMDSYYYLRKTIPMKPIAAEANRPNQLKKWGLEGTMINCLFET